MVGGACVLFIFAAYIRAVFHTGYIVGIGAVEEAVGKLFLVESEHAAVFNGQLLKLLNLLLTAVNPDNIVGLSLGCDFSNPVQ